MLKPLGARACYRTKKGWEGQDPRWGLSVCLSERAEAGGDTDLVLTQLWERPLSKKGFRAKRQLPRAGSVSG